MKPSPSLPAEISSGNDAIFENQFGGVAGPQTQLVLFLARTKTLGSFLHDERRQSVRCGAIGHRNDHINIGIVAVGAESLGAVQHPAIAFAHRGHARAARIRSGRRFGQSPCPDRFSAGEAGDVFSFLCFVPSKKNMIRAQRSMCRDDDADRTIHAREFFDGGDVLHIAHACAAVLGRKNDAQQAEFAYFFNDRRQGKLPASSHSITWGAISRSANSRTLFLSCSCSSFSWKSKVLSSIRANNVYTGIHENSRIHVCVTMPGGMSF